MTALRRYRSVEELPEPPPARSPLDGLAAACRLSELSLLFGRGDVAPRGIRRFRSVEEADRHRDAWEVGRSGFGSSQTERG